MPTVSEGRQTSTQMLTDLLPGNVRIGVSVYDQARGRTYRHVPGEGMRVYLPNVTRAEITRLWHAIERVVNDDKTWRTEKK